MDFNLTSDSKKDYENLEQTEEIKKKQVNNRKDIIKNDRLSFNVDWNDLRRRNEEFIRKNDSKEQKEKEEKIDAEIKRKAEQKEQNEEKNKELIEEKEKEKEKALKKLDDEEITHVQSKVKVGVDEEQFDILRIEFQDNFKNMDVKIDKVYQFSERLFGGLAEELLKKDKGKNKFETLEYYNLNTRIDEQMNTNQKLLQFLNQMNNTNN